MSYNDEWNAYFTRRVAEQELEAERAAAERHFTTELASRRVHNASQAAGHEQRRFLERSKPWFITAAVLLVTGVFCGIIGAFQNSPDAGGRTPGAGMLIAAGICIGLCVLITAITVVVIVIGVNYAAHPLDRKRPPNPAPWILSFLGCLAVFIIGAAILAANSATPGPAGKSASNLGIALIVTGLAGGAIWLVMGILHVFRPQRMAYKRWMVSLTPQERAVVYTAQAAGLLGLHEIMRHQNSERAARHARQVWNNDQPQS